MMHYVDIASEFAGLAFSIVGTAATVIGLIPTFRHKAVKGIAMAFEHGRMAARERQ